MALDTPTHKEIINRMRSDLSSQLPELDPTIFGSFARAFVESCGNRSFDLVLLIEQLERELFPQTATGEYLERWANYEAITRSPATQAEGPIVITGTGTVPAGSELSTSDGNLYTTDTGATLSENTLSVSSIVRSGTIATATTTSDHNLASNMAITMAGADQADYNGEFTITVLSETTFSFTVNDSPTTPATGTITATYNGALVNVTSTYTGEDQNVELGGKLSFTSTIEGVETDAYVTYAEVSGAEDAETDASLLARIMQSRSAPVANFNVGAIEKLLLALSYVTRVKVKEITPEVGDVTVLFVNDNADTIIPTTTDVNAVKEALLTIKPATTSDDSVIVTAPTAVTTAFTFSAISPDTDTMRLAIADSLASFYEDSVDFETDISEDKYRAAIIDTIDTETGEGLDSFTLTTPSGVITVGEDEIGVLGEITFN